MATMRARTEAFGASVARKPCFLRVPRGAATNCGRSSARRFLQPAERISATRIGRRDPRAGASAEVTSTANSLVRKFLDNQDEGLVKGYKIASSYWEGMKRQKSASYKTVLTQVAGESAPGRSGSGVDYDVVVCGGNLSIAIALALQNRGHRVLIVERRLLRGRTQEWNASRKECMNLVKAGLLSLSDLEDVIISEFNPNRVTFKGGEDVWVEDILNVGVAPDELVSRLKERFLAAGGHVRELCEFRSATVYEDMAVVEVRDVGRGKRGLGGDGEMLDMVDVNKPNAVPTGSEALGGGKGTVTCSLLVDCMGHFSPVVKQLRGGQKPDSIVLVVGGCITEGVPKFTSSDILASFTDAERDMQYFWETFPAKEGTTMYMFTYCDADESRDSFETFLESFLQNLPAYCRERLEAGEEIGIKLGGDEMAAALRDVDDFVDDLKFSRLLFGAFPSYKKCPLSSPFDRMVLVGDSSAVQSPLSFGGFGAMLRHVGRLEEALHEALEGGHLRAADLKLVQPYMPGLATAWLFQKAMGFEPSQMEGGQWTPEHVNRVLKANFAAMKTMENSVLLSFLQDTILWWPLTRTMLAMTFFDPVAILRVVFLLGPKVRFLFSSSMICSPFVLTFPLLQDACYLVRPLLDAWTVHHRLEGFGAVQIVHGELPRQAVHGRFEVWVGSRLF